MTSNLDLDIQRADDSKGKGGIRGTREQRANPFVVKILTFKPLGLKILQSIFAER